ncbi:D-glycerate dehydrogenase, variant 2 [Balamuthia mandrillaris]
MEHVLESRKRSSLDKQKVPKVFCTRQLPQDAFDLIKDLVDLEVWEGEDAPPRAVLLEKVKDCDGLISLLTDKIDAELFDAAPRLKVVCQYAVGFNNVDLEAATKRGIYITNTPGVLTDTVVETTFALLFAAARRIAEGDRYIRSHKWNVGWHPLMLLGDDLCGSTLGIIGLGRIGKKVAVVAQAFGASVVYNDEYRSQDFEEQQGVRFVELEELYRVSDFISVHVNLTEKTKHLINEQALRQMKPNCVIVNTARGPVIDQKALTDALMNQVIRAAGLDVFEQEPIDKDDPLLQLENVVCIPHLGTPFVLSSVHILCSSALR